MLDVSKRPSVEVIPVTRNLACDIILRDTWFTPLKKKAKSIARSKTLKVSNAKGKLSYRITAAKKGKSKKNLKKKFKINAKTGKITVKKGLKKGTYKVTVKVKAKGTANYKASAWKTVKVKVMVK